jgi:hypothetical protein
MTQKFVWPSNRFIFGLGHTIPVYYIYYIFTIKGWTFFLAIWTIWVSKDAEFYVDFKNINLPL